MLSSLFYHKFPLLKSYVKCIWVLESQGAILQEKTYPFFADGFPGIMYKQSEFDVLLNENREKLPDLCLYGQIVRPIQLHTPGKHKIILFYLYPTVIKALFGIEAHEIRDNYIDFDFLNLPRIKSLKDRLFNLSDTCAQIQLIGGYLQSMILRHTADLDLAVQNVCSKIFQTNGKIKIQDIKFQLKISKRTLERKFLAHVGVTPQLYCRICRFNATMNYINSIEFSKFSDIAYDNDFADQAHFIRTFKEFTGYAPRSFLRGVSTIEKNGKEITH